MGIVPVGLKEKFDRYLRNNAERTDARLGDTVTDSLSTEQASIDGHGTAATFIEEQPRKSFVRKPPVGSSWSRSSNNPLIEGSGSGWDGVGAADPEAIVLPDHDTAPIWVLYEGFETQDASSGTIGVAYADHPEGPFTRASDVNPIFNEYSHQSFPSVFRRGGDIYLLPANSSSDTFIELWKQPISDFPSSNWTKVTRLDFNIQNIGDSRLIFHEGTPFLFMGMLTPDNVFIRVVALDDFEDFSTATLVGDIMANTPSGAEAARSPYLTQAGDSIVFWSQRQDQRGVYGGLISDLSARGFSLTWFDDNPVLEPSGGGFDSDKLHALSVIEWDGEWWGYFDGRTSNYGDWSIGVASMEAI